MSWEKESSTFPGCGGLRLGDSSGSGAFSVTAECWTDPRAKALTKLEPLWTKGDI